uniref:Chromosome 5 open reading frame 47 n=1 Tax=Callithrix jacchus TaxID=9483 RepID=A0A5F4W518_CALJA
MAAAASQGREQDWARFVYVTRFGSHQCGGVLKLGGRQTKGLWGRESRTGCCQEKPIEATAVPGVPGGGKPTPGSRPRVPAAPGVAVAASASSSSSQLRTSSGRSSTRPVASAGLIQKDAAKKFDFPIPLNEASKIMKKKKKVSVWNRVHKVISRMLEENEKYRHRLKCQRLSSESMS